MNKFMQDLVKLAEKAKIRWKVSDIHSEELTLEELEELCRNVDFIIREELFERKIKYEKVRVRIYDAKSVGVQGDGRTDRYPVEIHLEPKRTFYELPDFIANLSIRITNEIKWVNRVTYLFAEK